MDIDRTKLFSKYNDVCLRKSKDGRYVCYECKLNNDSDAFFLTIENAINHLLHHKQVGHKPWSYVLKNLELEKEIQDHAVTEVTVHYAISNNGDGSASVLFFKTPEAADKYDQNMDEGWGEPCNASDILYFDKDGVLINPYTPDDDE